MTKRKKHGFTLVEILIVVVILGILAAIVIPQFSQASLEARESSLKSNLQAVRSQIELYKIQHIENLPGTQGSVTFVNAMTNSTDSAGATTGTDYGPYMRAVPVNPFIPGTVTTLVNEGTTTPVVGDDTSHWYFNTSTGEFVANDSQNDPSDSAATGEHALY